ncbi:MAG TPA: hypothetical protein VFE53_07690, partial [Mucilaginibacter sp.]|nr:hypothetical protein [Mucilaginibacter sp.]
IPSSSAKSLPNELLKNTELIKKGASKNISYLLPLVAPRLKGYFFSALHKMEQPLSLSIFCFYKLLDS